MSSLALAALTATQGDGANGNDHQHHHQQQQQQQGLQAYIAAEAQVKLHCACHADLVADLHTMSQQALPALGKGGQL
jgi:3-deoxy-D-arabino-heptulosonate 7-phosphate (DAHP) synthase class II